MNQFPRKLFICNFLYVKRFHRTASKVGAERKRLSITSFWAFEKTVSLIVSLKSDGKDN